MVCKAHQINQCKETLKWVSTISQRDQRDHRPSNKSLHASDRRPDSMVTNHNQNLRRLMSTACVVATCIEDGWGLCMGWATHQEAGKYPRVREGGVARRPASRQATGRGAQKVCGPDRAASWNLSVEGSYSIFPTGYPILFEQ